LPSSSHGSTATSSSLHGASEEKSKVVIEEFLLLWCLT
jgi:hypothetical protein